MHQDMTVGFDLQRLFADITGEFVPRLAGEGRRWMLAMPADLPKQVRGDAQALASALRELLQLALADASVRSPLLAVTRVQVGDARRLQLRVALEQTAHALVWTAEPSTDPAQLHDSPPPGLRDLRVLVIDRQARVRQLIADCCRSAGMNPVQARDGLTALSSIDLANKTEHPFDLIVLDEKVAERTCLGTRLADTVAPSRLVLVCAARQSEGRLGAPMAVTDGDDSADQRVQSVQAPFTPAALLSACERAYRASAPKSGAADRAVRPAATMNVLTSIHGLDTAAGMASVEGKVDLYRRLLCLFRDGQRDLRAKVDMARQTGSEADLRRLLHTLKGNARSLGMPALGEAAARVEQALKTGTTSSALDIPIEIVLIEAELMISSLDVLGAGRP